MLNIIIVSIILVECNIRTYKDIKDVLEKKSVRARLLFIAGAGLPFSGTSTLLQGVLNSYDILLPNPRELCIYPTAVFLDSVKKGGHFIVFDKKEKDYGMLLIALTKQLITKKFTIHTPLQDSGQLFENPEVNTCFKVFCDDLLKFKNDLEKDSNLVVAIMKSHCFINFLDITVNKAIYECLFIVGSWCKNGFLLGVLNLYYYSCKVLEKSLDLSESHFQGRGYRQEDIDLLKAHPACHFFVSIFEGTFSKQEDKGNRTLLVCTHKDELSESEMLTRMNELQDTISDCGQTMKSSFPSLPNILAINNTKGSPDHKRVRKRLVSLIEEHLKYSDDIELKHLFFYSYLKSTNQKFLTREEVNNLGFKCEINNKSEVSKCLQLLHDSCFLFYFHDFVILDLSGFIGDIDKLYCIQTEKSENPLLTEFKNGFFSKNLCLYIWDQDLSRSDSYIFILTRVGLMTKLKNHKQEYFMPSLRAEYEQEIIDGSSTSLLVLTDTTIIPFHKQCMFVECFQEFAEVLGSLSYNVLKLQLKDDNVIVKILFCNEFLEISLDFSDSKLQPSAYSRVYSDVKSSCALVLNRMRRKDEEQIKYEVLDFRYRFAVWCPRSNTQGAHYIPFEESCQPGEYWCNTCKANIEEELMAERALWMKSACKQSTLHEDDILNASNLLEIAEKLTSSHLSSDSNSGDLCKLFIDRNMKMKLETASPAEGLSAESEPSSSAQEQLFHALYEWHCFNRSASRIKLAEVIYDEGHEKSAFAVEPYLNKWLGTKERNLPISPAAMLEIAEDWPSGTDELAKILKVESQKSLDLASDDIAKNLDLFQRWSKENCGKNQRKQLKELFEKHEYYSIAERL